MIGKSKLYIKKFDQVKQKDLEIVGEEGYSLVKLFESKVPMPNGFLLTTISFDDFLLENNLIDPIVQILQEVQPFVYSSAQNASERIANLILEKPMPESLQAQLAESYFNLGNGTTPFVTVEISNIIDKKFIPATDKLAYYSNVKGIEQLKKTIKMIWLSLFTPEAIELRTNGYYKGELSVGVIIKRSVMSEISGILYGVPPTTKNNKQLEIHAYYGIENTNQEVLLSADIYTVNKKTLHIDEKKIVPQKYMLVRKGTNTENGIDTAKVEISKEWQKRQKIDDTKIIKIAKKYVELEPQFNKPLVINWGLQTGEWFVTHIEENEELDSELQIEKTSEDTHREQAERQEEQSKKDDDKLEELQARLEEQLYKKDTQKDKAQIGIEEAIKKAEREISFPNPKGIKEQRATATWQDELLLNEQLVLNISDFSSAEINSIPKFNGTFVDGTNLILKHGELPEFKDTSHNELYELINSFSLDIAVAAQNSNFKPIFYQFSNITQVEYSQLGIKNAEDMYVGDERFIENPTSLASEVRALKILKNNHFKDTLSVIIPSLRSTQNVADIIKIINSQKLERSANVKFFVEASIPSFVFDIPNLNKKLVDGVVVNYDMFLKLSVFRERIRGVDHNVVSRTLQPLAKVIRNKEMALGIIVFNFDKYVLENIVKLKPDFIIFGNIPTEGDIEIIKQAEKHVFKE